MIVYESFLEKLFKLLQAVQPLYTFQNLKNIFNFGCLIEILYAALEIDN